MASTNEGEPPPQPAPAYSSTASASSLMHQPSAPPMANEPPPAYNEVVVGGDKPAGVYPPLPSMPHAVPEQRAFASGGGPYPAAPLAPPPHGQPMAAPQPIFVGSLHFNAYPCGLTCPFCQAQIQTRTSTRAGLLTWLLCGGLAFFGCWICCCIPFCVEGCQDIEHSCPRCNRFLGTYKRI